MFLTHSVFNASHIIRFEHDQVKTIKFFSKELSEAVKAKKSVSLYLCSYEARKVEESEEFWKKAGNLMRIENNIDIFK